MQSYTVVITTLSGSTGLEVSHPSLRCPFHAASVALGVAGTEEDHGRIFVKHAHGSDRYEFIRQDEMLAIV